MTTKELLKQAKKLDIDQRKALAHQIWMSAEEECVEHEGDISEELKRKIDERLDDIKKNPDAWYTQEEMMQKLKERQAKRIKNRS